MEIKFKIAKYYKESGTFTKDGYDEYTITYLPGIKVHRLRIVVNGYLSKQTINLVNFREGYKDKILLAIKEFIKNHSKNKNRVTKKKVTIDYIKQFYSKQIIRNIENYLIKITKEDSRDRLTKYGLINLEDDTPYCSDCGNEDLKYLGQYANGEEYECKECGKKFIY